MWRKTELSVRLMAVVVWVTLGESDRLIAAWGATWASTGHGGPVDLGIEKEYILIFYF